MVTQKQMVSVQSITKCLVGSGRGLTRGTTTATSLKAVHALH